MRSLLPGNGQLRFDTGLGEIPSHLMYNDVDGTLMIPHAALLAVNQPYASITQAPLDTYRDSNAGTNGGYFPAAGGAGGDINAVFTLSNGRLNATFTATSGTLGTIALTDGTKALK